MNACYSTTVCGSAPATSQRRDWLVARGACTSSAACRHPLPPVQLHHLTQPAHTTTLRIPGLWSHRIQRQKHRTCPSAGAMDGMPVWTLDQIAGLVFGAVLMASVLSARSVDEWVARAQRRQLGLCEACGGLYDPATCAQDKCPSKAKK